MPYTEHQARKAMINKEENMEPPLRKPRAGTLPSSVPTTPTKKAPTEMPPPLAPITPRARKTPARGNGLWSRVLIISCYAENKGKKRIHWKGVMQTTGPRDLRISKLLNGSVTWTEK